MIVFIMFGFDCSARERQSSPLRRGPFLLDVLIHGRGTSSGPEAFLVADEGTSKQETKALISQYPLNQGYDLD